MATATYTPIASITLGSSASSVTFSSIPQDYRDLVLVINASLTGTNNRLKMTLNSDTGSNYSTVRMYGNGSTATSDSNADGTNDIDVGFYSNSISMSQIQIMDYSATDKHTTILGRLTNNATGFVTAEAARYASTNAITSIDIEPASVDFATGATFALWGIAS